MNKFIAIGRLTGDPDIRYSQDGKAVVHFNFAVNRRFHREGDADADFFLCVTFGKTAETFEKCSISKGTKLLIDAEVRNNNYTNKDGQKVYGTQVVVNSFEFCESKGAAQPTPQTDSNGFMTIPDGLDSELPFD